MLLYMLIHSSFEKLAFTHIIYKTVGMSGIWEMNNVALHRCIKNKTRGIIHMTELINKIAFFPFFIFFSHCGLSYQENIEKLTVLSQLWEKNSAAFYTVEEKNSKVFFKKKNVRLWSDISSINFRLQNYLVPLPIYFFLEIDTYSM